MPVALEDIDHDRKENKRSDDPHQPLTPLDGLSSFSLR